MQKMYQELLKMLPIKTISSELKKSIKLCLQSVKEKGGEENLPSYVSQFKTLLKKLNSASKLISLRDKMHRALIVQLIVQRGINFYNHSYFNRAKLTEKHLELLGEVGPFLFVEGVMIVSKMNVIYRNYSRIFIEDRLYQENQDSVDIQIRAILKMCDDKKRSINNNLKKLQHLFRNPSIRVELVKQLGKLLRDSWKKQKSKNKCMDILEDINNKELVKIPTKDGYEEGFEGFPEELYADYDYEEKSSRNLKEEQEEIRQLLMRDCEFKCSQQSQKKSGKESVKLSSLPYWDYQQKDGDCLSLKSYSIGQSKSQNKDAFQVILGDMDKSIIF